MRKINLRRSVNESMSVTDYENKIKNLSNSNELNDILTDYDLPTEKDELADMIKNWFDYQYYIDDPKGYDATLAYYYLTYGDDEVFQTAVKDAIQNMRDKGFVNESTDPEIVKEQLKALENVIPNIDVDSYKLPSTVTINSSSNEPLMVIKLTMHNLDRELVNFDYESASGDFSGDVTINNDEIYEKLTDIYNEFADDCDEIKSINFPEYSGINESNKNRHKTFENFRNMKKNKKVTYRVNENSQRKRFKRLPMFENYLEEKYDSVKLIDGHKYVLTGDVVAEDGQTLAKAGDTVTYEDVVGVFNNNAVEFTTDCGVFRTEDGQALYPEILMSQDLVSDPQSKVTEDPKAFMTEVIAECRKVGQKLGKAAATRKKIYESLTDEQKKKYQEKKEKLTSEQIEKYNKEIDDMEAKAQRLYDDMEAGKISQEEMMRKTDRLTKSALEKYRIVTGGEDPAWYEEYMDEPGFGKANECYNHQSVNEENRAYYDAFEKSKLWNEFANEYSSTKPEHFDELDGEIYMNSDSYKMIINTFKSFLDKNNMWTDKLKDLYDDYLKKDLYDDYMNVRVAENYNDQKRRRSKINEKSINRRKRQFLNEKKKVRSRKPIRERYLSESASGSTDPEIVKEQLKALENVIPNIDVDSYKLPSTVTINSSSNEPLMVIKLKKDNSIGLIDYKSISAKEIDNYGYYETSEFICDVEIYRAITADYDFFAKESGLLEEINFPIWTDVYERNNGSSKMINEGYETFLFKNTWDYPEIIDDVIDLCSTYGYHLSKDDFKNGELEVNIVTDANDNWLDFQFHDPNNITKSKDDRDVWYKPGQYWSNWIISGMLDGESVYESINEKKHQRSKVNERYYWSDSYPDNYRTVNIDVIKKQLKALEVVFSINDIGVYVSSQYDCIAELDFDHNNWSVGHYGELTLKASNTANKVKIYYYPGYGKPSITTEKIAEVDEDKVYQTIIDAFKKHVSPHSKLDFLPSHEEAMRIFESNDDTSLEKEVTTDDVMTVEDVRDTLSDAEEVSDKTVEQVVKGLESKDEEKVSLDDVVDATVDAELPKEEAIAVIDTVADAVIDQKAEEETVNESKKNSLKKAIKESLHKKFRRGVFEARVRKIRNKKK